jgi:hypothetical protein
MIPHPPPAGAPACTYGTTNNLQQCILKVYLERGSQSKHWLFHLAVLVLVGPRRLVFHNEIENKFQ